MDCALSCLLVLREQNTGQDGIVGDGKPAFMRIDVEFCYQITPVQYKWLISSETASQAACVHEHRAGMILGVGGDTMDIWLQCASPQIKHPHH